MKMRYNKAIKALFIEDYYMKPSQVILGVIFAFVAWGLFTIGTFAGGIIVSIIALSMFATAETSREGEKIDEDFSTSIKSEVEDILWGMSIHELLSVNRSRIVPSCVELLNQRILDTIDSMTPSKLRMVRPFMFRYNEGFIPYLDNKIYEFS